MIIIGLDPGTTKSALVWWDGQKILNAICASNKFCLDRLRCENYSGAMLVIEQIASFGMPVGAEIFETVFWSGRFAEAYGMNRVARIKRIDVKTHLCHSAKAKDANVSQALKDKIGPVGNKKTPGPLFGISSHLWAALAVAVVWREKFCPVESEF